MQSTDELWPHSLDELLRQRGTYHNPKIKNPCPSCGGSSTIARGGPARVTKYRYRRCIVCGDTFHYENKSSGE